ncbi:MAG: hypothetical protein PHR92_13310 [Lachnospiraceae bacterium]|nr:hypothetical protein [Lachnospiraceae bacterium]
MRKKKGLFVSANVLTMLCTLCIRVMVDPFCILIFHEPEEPQGIGEWRAKHDK